MRIEFNKNTYAFAGCQFVEWENEQKNTNIKDLTQYFLKDCCTLLSVYLISHLSLRDYDVKKKRRKKYQILSPIEIFVGNNIVFDEMRTLHLCTWIVWTVKCLRLRNCKSSNNFTTYLSLGTALWTARSFVCIVMPQIDQCTDSDFKMKWNILCTILFRKSEIKKKQINK